ncbi:sugar kinase, partial [Lichenihabitans sp. Uapishka_5]|uniref:carbohydrate kinase family protein n=1 Tax=Lichenihabitans sp. Uapishka_5 TaxID=3037302 RepID=UPI0029E7DF7A
MPGTVVVVGDVMTDIIVKPHGLPAPGSDQPATITPVPGGSAANQAVWLASFGVPVVFAGRVGSADHGWQDASFRESGIVPRLAADPDLGTGTLVTLLSPDGERSFFTDRGANEALCRADLPDSLLDEAAILHLSGYALVSPGPRAAVTELMATARRRGIPVTIDPGSAGFLRSVGPEHFLRWTSGAAICFPNADEAATLAVTEDRDEQLRCLSDIYGLLVVKRGPAGAEAANRHGAHWTAAGRPAGVLDTTGAGDAFLAAFLAGYLKGAAIPICLARGVEAGARATEVYGGRPVPA